MRKFLKKFKTIRFLYQKIYPPRLFVNSSEYWENRYKRGGTSGSGSYGNLAIFKAEIMNEFILDNNILSVVELGCGDGNNLGLMNYPNYVGLDVAKSAIDICKEKYAQDNSKKFFLINDYKKILKYDLSVSLDVIYHLVEDDTYYNYMNKLFSLTEKYVAIYSSNFDSDQNNHVKHRHFTKYINNHFSDFELINIVKNHYPFDEKKPDSTSLANFYFFKKIDI